MYNVAMNEEDLMKNYNKKKVYFKALPKPAMYTKEKKLTVEDFIFEDSHFMSEQRIKKQQGLLESSAAKDRRIKELEEEIVDLKAEIEMLKAVNQEC